MNISEGTALNGEVAREIEAGHQPGTVRNGMVARVRTGPDNARVEVTVEEAGVALRICTNCFPNRDHAIAAAATPEWGIQIAA